MTIDVVGTAPADPIGPRVDQGIGIVCPYDMALDRELWRWMPEGVSLFFTRTPFYDQPVSVEMAKDVSNHTEVCAAVRSLLAVDPLVVVYACTSGSFVRGIDGERSLSAQMREAGARKALTTSGALLLALEELRLVRIAVATPYAAELTDRLAGFLAEARRSVVSHVGLGLDRGIWKVSYAATCELIRRADRPEADAVFLSCTNLPSFDIITHMEQELGKPVLSANQVTAWAALRELGRSALGRGQRLLAGDPR